jgi:phage gp16-like protein
MAKLASDSRFVLLCLLANAIHRKQVNGHNWITEDTSRNNTPAKKATSIAAAESGAFAEFMARYGHDLWHFLNDSSLYSAADHLTGHVPVKIVKSVLYGGNE